MTIPNIEIYADGAHLSDITNLSQDNMISGFTTNPSLMKQAGIASYREFAIAALNASRGKPVSFEVVADDLSLMEQEAVVVSGWGPNVRVKVPISNSTGHSSVPMVRNLLDRKVPLNITAVMTDGQVEEVLSALHPDDDIIISVFAGRIADTGRDPVPIIARYVSWAQNLSARFLWASPREVLNLWHAAASGCHIITLPKSLLEKLSLHDRNLAAYSLETVQMFLDDARTAGLVITESPESK